MKLTITIILFSFLFSSCNYRSQNIKNNEESPSSTPETITAENVYDLINDFILDSLYKTSLFAFEAMSYYNTGTDREIPYELGRYCSYDSTLFQELIKLKIIDSRDRDSILTELIKKERIIWDTTKIKIQTFSFYQLDNLVKNNPGYDPYGYTRKEYNSRNFLLLSYPVFLNENAILLGGSFFCDGLCGHGEIYVFCKKNGKWTILFSHWTWMS
jgi:hypothetical protein